MFVGKPESDPFFRRGGCTINCNLDNHVPFVAFTKCAQDGRSSVSRRRIATEKADYVTDEILESKLGPFTKREAAKGHTQEHLDRMIKKG